MPPGPILEEFSALIGMSSEGLSHKPFVPHDLSVLTRSRGRPKGRSHSDFSPLKDNHGKRPNSCVARIDEVLNKVLDRIAFDKSISKQMVFKEGVCDIGKVYGSKSNILYYSINGNDGSFISKLCALSVVVKDCNRVWKDKESGLDVCVDPLLVSNDTSKLNMADEEHGEDESIRKANKDQLDGMNVDSDFVFRDLKRNKGIHNRPHVRLTKVQFGPSLFYKSSNVWSSFISGENGVKSNGSLNIESFAKKMKKGVEDRELQMKFKPQYVFVQGCLLKFCASDELPNFLKIEYPASRDGPGRIGKLIVKYQWKPTQCSHCKTFGHSTSACKVRPRTKEEVVAKFLKESLKVDKDSYVKVGGDNNDNDGFVEVGKKNKHQDRNVSGGFKSQSNGVKHMGIGKALWKEKGNGVGSSMANFVPALKKFVKPHDDREYDDVESDDEGMAVEMKFGMDSSGVLNVILMLSLNQVKDPLDILVLPLNKSPLSFNGLLKKLDTVICNMGFLDKFPNANAIFLPFVCFDHAPSVLSIPNIVGPKLKPFKFANFLSLKAKFLPLVKSVWDVEVLGHAMFSLAFKLKMLKKPDRKLKFSHGDLADKVNVLKDKMCKVQEVMVREPFNAEIRVVEVVSLKAYISAVKDEELFLKQRMVEYVEDMDGNSFSRHDVKEHFVKHFMNVLGTREMVAPIHERTSLFINKLSLVDFEFMVKPISLEEIKDVRFSMNDDKAPGPDGYSARFFKAAWSVVGSPQTILDFFLNGMRGLRQGEPLSPYLFTLIMEVLSLLTKQKILNNSNFKFQWKCEKASLTHLCFADDLIAFSHGDLNL
nr:hypothetical protein [Tanacetum cinerariifolium]